MARPKPIQKLPNSEDEGRRESLKRRKTLEISGRGEAQGRQQSDEQADWEGIQRKVALKEREEEDQEVMSLPLSFDLI